MTTSDDSFEKTARAIMRTRIERVFPPDDRECLPNRWWNSAARAPALEYCRRGIERVLNEETSRVTYVDPASFEQTYRFLMIDNHDPGDEDGSER